MRIFIGLTEVAGYFGSLYRGFFELGIEATFVSLPPHPFEYWDRPPSNILIRLATYLARRYRASCWSIIRVGWGIAFTFSKMPLFLWALLTHDVFVFSFRSHFLWHYELPLLRLFKKKIIHVFLGSDTRPPYIGLVPGTRTLDQQIQFCIRQTRKQKRELRRIERYADIIVCNPLSSQLHTRSIISFMLLGFPRVQPPVVDVEKDSSWPLQILHAPSNPQAKGTPAVRQAVKNLRSRGYKFEYVEITNMPHEAVQSALAQCDFIVDQVYSDTPMAGFATEAALFGKPAVVGSYGHETIVNILPGEQCPPSYLCHPDEIEQAIEHLIRSDEYRAELGNRAKQFVETHWQPGVVAEKYLRLIRGDFPPWWLYDPNQLHYIHGAGVSADRIKERVSGILACAGKEMLQLTDKPELEKRLIQLALSD